MYFITGKVDEYIEEKNENKYLILASTDTSKEILTNYTKPWNGIKNPIGKITGKSGESGKNSMKIKFGSDDNLLLNKMLKLHNLTIVVISVFEEENKYYPQVFLD